MYLHSGVVELHRKTGRYWQRQIEYKEGFFSRINFRNMESIEPQWFKMVVKAKSIITVMPLRQPYSFLWLRQNWHKNQILSKIFYYNDTGIEIQRRKPRFKEFVRNFKVEVFRRDTRFTIQGRKNQKVYILGRGDAKIYKQMNIKNAKCDNLRNL